MKKIRYIPLLSLLILLTACEDFFRTTVEVDPPSYVKGIAVNLYIDDSDTVVYAMVSHNTGSLETVRDRKSLLLPGAVVTVQDEKGDVLFVMDTIMPANDVVPVNFVAYLDSAFGGNGRTFTLEVIHPGYEKVTATQTMPHKPEVSHPLFNPDGGFDDYIGHYGILSFTVHDRPGEENFYAVRVYVEDPVQEFNYFASIVTDDPLFETSYDWDALLLTDKTFDGEAYPVRIKVAAIFAGDDQTFPPGVRVFLDIREITKDMYLYDRTLEKAMEARDLGFYVEPVQVWDNIDHGFGLFGMSARRVVLAGRE